MEKGQVVKTPGKKKTIQSEIENLEYQLTEKASVPLYLDRMEIILYLRKAIRELGKECESLLSLRYFQGMSVRDIAAFLNIAPNTVSVKINRKDSGCLARLKKLLEADGYDYSHYL